MKEELEWINSLTRLKQEDKKRLLIIHRELFGASADPCLNCPDAIRQAVNRLKKYYEQNYTR